MRLIVFVYLCFHISCAPSVSSNGRNRKFILQCSQRTGSGYCGESGYLSSNIFLSFSILAAHNAALVRPFQKEVPKPWSDARSYSMLPALHQAWRSLIPMSSSMLISPACSKFHVQVRFPLGWGHLPPNSFARHHADLLPQRCERQGPGREYQIILG